MINYPRKNKLKKFLTSLVLVSILAYCTVIYLEKYGSPGVAFVEIKGQKITKTEIYDKISEIFASNSTASTIPEIETLPKEVIETFAREIYLEKELIKMAKKSTMGRKKDVKNKIKQAENRILIDAFLQDKIAKSTSEQQIKEKYLQLSSDLEGKREYLISHIVVESQGLANKIYKIYRRTAPRLKDKRFVSLAKRYSVDKESAAKGGNLGYVLEDNIVKPVLEAVSAIKKFGYTRPVKTDFGWHLVKVDAIRDAKVLPYEEAKENIKQQIIKNITDGIYQDIFDGAKVKFLISADPAPKKEEKEESTNE